MYVNVRYLKSLWGDSHYQKVTNREFFPAGNSDALYNYSVDHVQDLRRWCHLTFQLLYAQQNLSILYSVIPNSLWSQTQIIVLWIHVLFQSPTVGYLKRPTSRTICVSLVRVRDSRVLEKCLGAGIFHHASHFIHVSVDVISLIPRVGLFESRLTLTQG